MNRIFESAPTTWRPWALALAAGLVLFAIAETDKWRIRRRAEATHSHR
jgi:hypothetical protein